MLMASGFILWWARRVTMLRRSVFQSSQVRRLFPIPSTASVVYGQEGVCWKYDPDFEPTEPCLRAGLKGNPYGTRKTPYQSTVHNRKLYRLPLDHPLWKEVYQSLDDVGVGRDWLDLTIPAVLPAFPIEGKKQNPHWRPGKYPTIRNAYYEQQQIQFKAEREENLRQFYDIKYRKQNRWKKEKKKHGALEAALQEISGESLGEVDEKLIESSTKAIEGSQ